METLVPTDKKRYYTVWCYVCDELRSAVNDARTAIAANRGRSALTQKTRTIERLSTRYDKVWIDLCDALLSQSVVMDDFYKEHTILSQLATCCLDELSDSLDQLNVNTNASPSMPAKLPEVKLPEFNGDFDQWSQFWDLFTSLIDNRTDLSVAVKFNYLRSALKGPCAKLVSGFIVNENNYNEAKGLLRSHYADDNRCIRNLVRKFGELKTPRHEYKELSDFRIQYNHILRSLKAFKNVDLADWFICELLVLRLSSETQNMLFQRQQTQYFTFEEFDKALETLVQLLEGSKPSSKESDHAKRGKKPESPGKSNVSWSATAEPSPKSSATCVYCEQSHYSNKCPTYVTLDQRRDVLRSKKLCLKCSKKGHFASDCTVKLRCFICKGNHWIGLCPKAKSDSSVKAKQPESSTPKATVDDNKTSVNKSSDTSTNRVSVHTTSERAGGVALPTAIFKVRPVSKDGTSVHIRCFLDSGSQKSFVHPRVLEQLNIVPKKDTTVNLATFGHDPESIRCPVVKLKLSLGNRVANVHFLVTDRVQMELHTPGLKDTVAMLKHRDVRLADSHATDKLSDIVAVIGADCMTKFIRGVRKVEGVNLLDSSGGFIVYGTLPFGTGIVPTVNQSVCCSRISLQNYDLDSTQISNPLEPKVEKLWELDAIGISDDNFTPSELKVLQEFADTIEFKDGKFFVRLPWRKEPENLPTNYRMAIGQYRSLMKGLQADPVKFKHYDKVITDYLSNDFIEEVREPQVCGHYLPHHAVFKDSVTTPLRVVFNASAKVGDNLSLNDVLETGPMLSQKLIDSLLTFRVGKYGLIADISKAFLRVGLQEVDRNFVRFLWSSDPSAEPKTFRFKSVLFGSTSSPFLLQATLYKHFRDSKSPIKEVLAKSFYVDNFLTTVDNPCDLDMLRTETTKCLAEAGFPLQEWNSNFSEFNEIVGDSGREACPSVLGVRWDTDSDTLAVKSVRFKPVESLTKRKALAFFSSLYDPLGLLSPVSIKGKLFIRQLWLCKLGWDELLSNDLVEEFNVLASEYEDVSDLKFPRSICEREANYTLHVFTDASTKAYGAVSYLCTETESTMLMSRSRVAPVKERTIPQLELTAVLLGCRLAKYIKNTIPCTLQIYVWSDNLPCLYWIHNNKSNIVYVKNRVSEILNLRNELNITFLHVGTDCNPADILSRGMSLSNLSSSRLWQCGPSWLCFPEQWPQSDIPVSTFEIVTQDIPVQPPNSIIAVDRYSSLSRLLLVTKYILTFAHKVSKGRVKDADPLRYWLRHEQQVHYPLVYEALVTQSHENKYISSHKFISDLALYLDGDSIIRSRGRMCKGVLSHDSNNPVILPPKSFLCTLIVRFIHDRCLHAGTQETLNEVRDNYWIPRGRQTVKTVIKQCVVCRYDVRKKFKYPGPPPLPKERVKYDHPFSTSGVDFTGALKLKVNQEVKKFYVCLFTCTATRAVHLELVDSMSAESFILCLRRFAARCSLPVKFISDNGANFAATNRMFLQLYFDKDVQTYLANNKIEWQFISPRAPWQGGFYERLIGIVKGCLHKALHKKQVTVVELQTILAEAEAVVNNRPLLYLGDDVKSERALTPAHLLYGRKIKLYPNIEVSVAPVESTDNVELLLSLHNHVTSIINKFKGLWSTEYLQSLREKHYSSQTFKSRRPIVGEVVILGLESPRDRWELARVTELVTGVDGEIREVVVLNKGQHLRKTVDKLIPLEVDTTEQPADVPEEGDNRDELDSGEIDNETSDLMEISHPDSDSQGRPVRRAAQAARKLLQDLIEEDAL